MKSIDVDAKHLIRTYIDGIEEYLREHTRLHPNEIDGLLNEINDFVYLRSGELAVEDRVHYNDVLKAIEECGSPSEICEQYLELDKEEQPEPFSPKIVPSPSEKPVTRSPKTALKQFKTQKKETVFDSIKSHDGFRNVSSFYNRFPVWFSLYRFFFILYISTIIVGLFGITNLAYYPEDWYVGSVDYFFDSLHHCYQTTLFAFILVFWESFLINKWKARLVREKGMDRSFDDTLIIWISRIGILMLLFKASLLLDYIYLLFVPIWLFLMCLVERQFKSELWVEKLGPWLVSLGSMFSNPQDNQTKDSISSLWNKFRSQYSSQEKGSAVILAGLLGFTFIFPWYSESNYPYGAFPFFLISSTVMIGITIVFSVSKESSFNDNESELIAWLMRLLTFKTILILSLINRIDPSGFYFGSVIIIGVLIMSEIVLHTYGGKSFRSWVGKALITFGGSSSTNNTLPTYSTKEHPLSSVENEQISKVESTVIYSQKSLDGSPDRKGVTEPVQIVPDEYIPRVKKPSLVARFFKAIGEIGIALLMTFLMLIFSFYEVILTFLVCIISFSYEGIYEVPVLVIGGFIFSILPYSTATLKGYTITIWHLFLFLGIQLFFIVTAQLYGLTAKKPEGVILKVCRNLTRILLGVAIIGILVHYFYDDLYSSFKLLIAFGLLFFSELTSWKVRSERKKFILPISEQETVVHDNEGRVMTRGEITKSS